MGRFMLWADEQLLVSGEGMHYEECEHKHNDIPRFGALVRR